MHEYAIVVNGAIENVVTTDNRQSAEEVARSFSYGDKATVVLLDTLPESVKRNYRFWNERP